MNAIRILPLCFCFILGIIFWQALHVNPQALPTGQVNQALPEFKIKTLDHHILKSSHLKKNISLLNVWSSWCDACAEEQLFMLTLAQQGIPIYGLNYLDQHHVADQWLKTYGNPYRAVGMDSEGIVATALGVYGTPETFLIAPGGKILYRHAGILTPKVWQKRFVPLLSQKVY